MPPEQLPGWGWSCGAAGQTSGLQSSTQRDSAWGSTTNHFREEATGQGRALDVSPASALSGWVARDDPGLQKEPLQKVPGTSSCHSPQTWFQGSLILQCE